MPDRPPCNWLAILSLLLWFCDDDALVSLRRAPVALDFDRCGLAVSQTLLGGKSDPRGRGERSSICPAPYCQRQSIGNDPESISPDWSECCSPGVALHLLSSRARHQSCYAQHVSGRPELILSLQSTSSCSARPPYEQRSSQSWRRICDGDLRTLFLGAGRALQLRGGSAEVQEDKESTKTGEEAGQMVASAPDVMTDESVRLADASKAESQSQSQRKSTPPSEAMADSSPKPASPKQKRAREGSRAELSSGGTEDTGTGSEGAMALSSGSASTVRAYRHPTNNAKRNMVRDKFAKALKPFEKEGDVYSALTAAVAIEHSMFRYFGKDEMNARYTAKCRSIMYNLRDAQNPDLRRRVLSGALQPERLTLMDPTEMASDALKRQRRVYAALSMRATTLGTGEDKHAVTDMFFCRRCKQRKCTYYQMQTRSADEPMTTFVTCLNCNNRWKE